MTLQSKKIFISCMVLALAIGSLAGCSKPNVSPNSSAVNSQQSSSASSAASSASEVSSAVDSSAVSSESASAASSSQQNDAQKALLLNMQKLAQDGKVINCDFAVKSNVIEDVQDKWGKEDKTEYIASAKGNYSTYSKHNAVFGFNKGSQLFEVRSFDSQLKNITLSAVKSVLGKPDHDVKSDKEEIIGYVINKDYKLLLVFPISKTGGADPKLDHYSVLYPQGTVNSMADDPGRQW